ncbi:hypothetical protein BU17DRAFT_64216 [Hysterangium stoloniferum]|nr:hypothetical protein BU17DRAFT_64216 [Hysterangium stoloniferum]
MSDVRITKRKADDLEPAAEADLKKRAKNDDEAVVEVVEAGDRSDEDSEEDLEDELKALAGEAPVLERRTRGVRVDYTQLKVDEEEEDEEDEEEEEEEQEEEVIEEVKENGFAGEGEGNEDEAGEEQNGHEDDEE